MQTGVVIPSATWKVAVVLEPGQDVSDITTDTQVVSIVTPNIERPKTLDPDPTLPETDPKGVNYWRYWGNWRYSVDYIEDQTGLDLLNNIPKEIQDALELNADEGTTTVNTFDKSLSASLLGSPVISEIGSSDTETSLNPIKTSANKNGIVQFGMVQVSESQISPTQVSPSEINEIKFSPTEISIPQISPTQIAGDGIVSPSISTQVSPAQINSSQNSSTQVDIGQLSIPQVSPTQINSSEVSLTSSIPSEQLLSSQSNSVEQESSFNAIETSTNQQSIVQVSPSQISISKVSPNQISTTEINGIESSISENSIPENSLTQISPAQINSTEIDTSKIPLTSSISSEQLLSSHNPTSYNFDNSASLLAPDNEIIHPSSVEYNPTTHTASLHFNGFEASEYQLIIDDNLQNPDGITLKAPYQVDFTAVSDFSELVDLEFTNTRGDRANETISFDVSLTNQTDYDLSLPLNLVLQPGNNSETAQPTEYTSINDTGAYWIDLSDSLPDGILKPGESITEQTVTIYNPDDLRFEYEPGIYTLPTTNQAPVFTSEPVTTATAGESYVYSDLAPHQTKIKTLLI